MKLIAAVITYYPDIFDTINNIRQYIDDVDTLIIWENTPQKDRDKYKILLPDYENKIIYKGTDKNEGIGYPLNRVIEYSQANGYTHLLTMDQDSLFIDFKKYKAKVEQHSDMPHVGIFSPNINNKIKSDSDIEKIPEAITSGSIYKLDIFSHNLNFREDFFIDMVDHEFCYHAYRNNIYMVAFPQCHLQQRFGNTIKYKIGISSLNYSAFRIYHIIRNIIVTWKEYPDLIQNKWTFISKVLFNRAIKIIFLEQDKKQKLRAMFWGIRDGLAGKMIERKFSHK